MIEVFLREIVAVEHSFSTHDVGVSVSVTWELKYCTNGTTGAQNSPAQSQLLTKSGTRFR